LVCFLPRLHSGAVQQPPVGFPYRINAALILERYAMAKKPHSQIFSRRETGKVFFFSDEQLMYRWLVVSRAALSAFNSTRRYQVITQDETEFEKKYYAWAEQIHIEKSKFSVSM
jgi:23S rRNA G2445 N2-methylase RlmL